METVLNPMTNLTFSQWVELVRQLPKQEKKKVIELLEEEEVITKEQLIADLREAIEEVNQYKQGKKQLRSVWEVLDEL